MFNDKGVENEIVILRDTGANLSQIDRQCLEDIETRFTRENQLLHGVTSEIVDSPMVSFQVRSAWIDGEIQTAIGSVLHRGVHVLLGNDLCKSNVLPQSVKDLAEVLIDSLSLHDQRKKLRRLLGFDVLILIPLVVTDTDNFTPQINIDNDNVDEP